MSCRVELPCDPGSCHVASDRYEPFDTRLNDCPNNTFRALRIVDPQLGNLMYAEDTMVDDWWFRNPYHYEAMPPHPPPISQPLTPTAL